MQWKKELIALLRELEFFFKTENLDVEFGIDSKKNLHLFQVRPLIIKNLTTTIKEHNK